MNEQDSEELRVDDINELDEEIQFPDYPNEKQLNRGGSFDQESTPSLEQKIERRRELMRSVVMKQSTMKVEET